MAKEKFETLPINLMEMVEKDFISSELLADGEERIYTIEGIREETLVNEKSKTTDIKPVVYFVETDLKLALNIVNIKTIQKIYNEARADKLVGKKIQLYRTTTSAFGQSQPCIRIRPFIPELKCSVCGKVIEENVYYGSIKKYGKPYCSSECLEKHKKGEKLL